MIQYSQTNVIYHINKMKNKNHMIISKDSENFDKTQYPFMIKLSTMWVLLRINRECNNIIKTIYNKLTVNIILNGEKLKDFPLRSG